MQTCPRRRRSRHCCLGMRLKNVKQNKQHIASLENNLEAGDVSLRLTGSLFHERPAVGLTLTLVLQGEGRFYAYKRGSEQTEPRILLGQGTYGWAFTINPPGVFFMLGNYPMVTETGSVATVLPAASVMTQRYILVARFPVTAKEKVSVL